MLEILIVLFSFNISTLHTRLLQTCSAEGNIWFLDRWSKWAMEEITELRNMER